MNGNQQFFPFVFPIPQSAGGQQPCDHRIPARVRVAIEFLNHLSAKTAERAAVNDVAVQSIPGQQLTPGETDAQQTACNMLVEYFEGKLRPDAVEALELESLKLETARAGSGDIVLRCMACNVGEARGNCVFCRGSGYSLIRPALGN